MAPSGDETMLARLGIHPAEPFDWGDEPRMSLDGAPPDPAAPLSGLHSLKKFVHADGDGNGGGGDGGAADDDDEGRMLRSLFRKARADLARPVPHPPADDRPERPPPADDDVTRDVSIRGLSDRAVAELTVESRTSLFGSILRLFDAPRDWTKKTIADDGGVEKEGGVDDAAAANDDDAIMMDEPVLSTAEIVRSVHLAARMGDIPPGMDSKEYAMAALRFLSSHVPHLHEDEAAYRSPSDGTSREGWDQLRSTLPVLPLIRATNPAAKLEVRRYARARPRVGPGRTERRDPDSVDRDESFRTKVLNLERVYSSSLPFSLPSTASPATAAAPPPSPSKKAAKRSPGGSGGNDLPLAFQRYVPRRKLLPHIEGGAKEELTLMISGHMQQPQHTPGPKPKTTKPKATKPTKPKAAAAAVGSNAGGAPSPAAKSASSGAAKSAKPPAAKSTKPPADRGGKGAVGSVLKPAKRKADKKIPDGSLHATKRGPGFRM